MQIPWPFSKLRYLSVFQSVHQSLAEVSWFRSSDVAESLTHLNTVVYPVITTGSFLSLKWWIGLSCVALSLSFERQLLLVRVKTTVKFRWFWAWLMPCAWKGCEMTVHTLCVCGQGLGGKLVLLPEQTWVCLWLPQMPTFSIRHSPVKWNKHCDDVMIRNGFSWLWVPFIAFLVYISENMKKWD